MNIAYYVSDGKYYTHIEKLKHYYINQNKANNFFIAYSVVIDQPGLTEIAAINEYYINFMHGKIVFSNLTDYKKKKDKIIASPVLFVEQENFKTLDTKVLKEFTEVLVLKNNNIKDMTHEKL
jgi:hypothetical protein